MDRIHKVIADSGFCSRRKAEELIKQKRVKVNGHTATIGQAVNSARDLITIDGEKIMVHRKKTHTYLIMHKPRGYITTTSDEKGRRCVMDLLPENLENRVYPVGRLDVNSEGLLFFTSDGKFANDLMHPSRHVAKTYRVTVRPDITDEIAVKLSTGVVIDGKKTMPANVVILSKEPNRVVLQIVIREGRNRQIRKMCEAVGLEVARLRRSAVGPIKLGMLKPGEVRELKPDELRAIRTAITKKKEN